MEVVFLESIKSFDYSVVIIVVHDQNTDFVMKKLREITKLSPKIDDLIDGLKYKENSSFDLQINNKFVKFIVIGAGPRELVTRASVEKLGGYIHDAVFSSIHKAAEKVLLINSTEAVVEDSAALLASGISLKSWAFDKYKAEKNQKKIPSIDCMTSYEEMNRRAYSRLELINNSVFYVRNLVTEPANIMTPDAVLEAAMELGKYGVKVNYLTKKDMEKLGMNALLGVASGSDLPPYLVSMEYRTDKSRPAIALIGKGVTFDSGGICLKPSKNMAEMKGDMTGAAIVMGTIMSVASQKLEANVVGIIGVVENMISGRAQRPGDVVVSMSGKTIEVDNTDAEGRLVLADVLWYAQEKFSLDVVIDVATLTGAIQVALGHEFAGLMSNSKMLSNNLIESGIKVGEKLWELPLHPSYEEDIKSDIADVRNVGGGRGAGSITAAMFLKQFIKDDIKWAHIDVAATEWDSRSRALSKSGATGFGVRLLADFVAKY
ncbi:MAG: leucyl aminopeptidase [Holosporales bacterium]|jgi:leucyl aminopeptidase|nr:leucyl aminopeptidase [Holosporales bacterium]